MRYATKYNAADAFSGRVEYKYCLSCDGALSERIEYNPSWTVVSHWRYEYDGLNLVRLDERYDADTPPDGIDAADPWRTLEAATHKPGALSSLLHKRVYTHANNDATPEATADFTYAYDAVGNVYCVWDGDGNEVYYFAQDAFGNEMPVDLLGQDSWSTARAAGITEHQTGKWLDPFTGLYYFQARYYDPAVGRFVGRDVDSHSSRLYKMSGNNPNSCVDVSGMCHSAIHHTDTYVIGASVLSGLTCNQRAPGLSMARAIAHADEGTDHGSTAPIGNGDEPRILYHCFGYYLSRGDDDFTPDWGRISGRYRKMLDDALDCCSAKGLGQALHFRQDCFVHWVFDPWPGHFPFSSVDSRCEMEPMRELIGSVTRSAIERFSEKCCSQSGG